MDINIKTTKLIFDTKDKPELAAAITARLVEMGGKLPNRTQNFRNISLNWKENSIHFGCVSVDDLECFSKHTLVTLDDLYDYTIPNPTFEVTIPGQTFNVSKGILKHITDILEEL